MPTPFWRTAASCAALLAVPCGAGAHAIAGARVFPVTLTLDDPGVADEATLPQVTYQRSGADGGPGPVQQVEVDFEYDKRITTDLGFAVNDGAVIQDTEHDKTRTGGENIQVTGKYQVYTDATHEFIATVGVSREFGRTGTAHTGADQYGATTPIVYFGKGLGDVAVDGLRPFALTGEASYTIADRALKQVGAPPATGLKGSTPGIGMAEAQFNNGNSDSAAAGLSLQYSLPYLVSQVHDIAAPQFVKHLVPLVELTWSSPTTSPSSQGTQIVVAPGFIWINRSYQFGLETLIPANRASGTTVGVVAQFHLFLDDLLPKSLGRPVADW